LKITLVGPVYPYRGGIAHFTGMLAQKLIEAGHDVQMISFKKQYPLWLYPGKSDKDYSEGREKIDAAYLLAPLNPLSWKRAVDAICKFKPEKVIFPWWVTIWGPAFHHIVTRLKKNDIPSTILIHNTLPHEAKPYDSFLARWALQEADNFIVMTQKEKFRLPDDEAAQYFEMSDIFIAPYKGGTQSGVLKAALGFGLPVVLTDIIIDEVTDHFPSLCKIVPSQNPQMLANGIEEQLNTPALSNAEIEGIFSKTWEKMVKTISDQK